MLEQSAPALRHPAGEATRAGGTGRPRVPSPWTLALAAVLLVALALRVWGIKHGLPYVYNVDEGANFVRMAVGFFAGDYNPHYFVNPPAFSYLLHAVLAVWFGGGWPFGARDAVSDAYATDPTAVFVVARATSAVLGTAALAFVYATGARLYDRRVGLLAAALLAVSFLPVFYSHLALNDVPALLPLAVSVWGSAGIFRYGRRRDYLIAGVGLGLAAATKYTAAIVALPLAVAFLFDLGRSRGAWRGAVPGVAIAAVAAGAAFAVANPHALLSYSEFRADVEKQEQAAGEIGKLGLSHDSGVEYYLWVLTWGVGWVPAFAAVVGAVVAARDDLKRALLLVPWPLVFIVFMGLQGRYFGRWLLPALPAVALLAAVAAVRLADLVRGSPRWRALVLAGASVAILGQGIAYTVHLDGVLSRDETRNVARAWMVRNIPAGSKIVVEPIVPDAWMTDPGRPTPVTPSGRRWRKFITSRTTIDESGRRRRGGRGRRVSLEDYERTTRPALIGSYSRGGFCWVVVGSTQYGRALAEPGEVPRAIRYYRSLDRRGDLVFAVDPWDAGASPVSFSFDWSFNYYPMAYERPGPAVRIYRLREADCARARPMQARPQS